MKKLFGKRKDKDKAAAGGTTHAAAAAPSASPSNQPLPPLRLAQLQEQGGGASAGSGGATGRSGGGTGRSGGPPTGGSSGRALVYTDSGYLRGLSPTTSGNYGRSLSRTTSGMSSGRRSARRPRELLDLSQPEPQVEGEDEDEAEWEVWPEALLQQGAPGAAPAGDSGWQPDGRDAGATGSSGGAGASAGPGRQLTYEEEAAQIEADMALAYQLAMQDQQGALAAQQAQQGAAAQAPDQQPPQALLQRASSSQSAGWGSASGSLRPPQPASYHRQSSGHGMGRLPSGPLQLQHSGRLQSGPASLSQLGSGSFGPAYSTASEDVAVAAALAESQFAAQQAAARAALAKAHEDQYQAAIEAAMEESLVTINYDDLLRDIQLWIFDLEGAVGDVNKALEEATTDTSEIDRQMAAADPDDAEGMHRLLWLSEQYPLVQARLQELAGRVAPVNDTNKALKDLCDFIRNDQPPLADAESVRDAVIARLFQDLGRQGLDAHHPFAAYGEGANGEEQARKKGGGLRRLLSIGSRKEKPAATRGGDLRDLVRQLIDEAKRIPPPPPMPVDYDPLLAQLRGWVGELKGVKDDVQAALELAHHNKEEAAAQLVAANPADKAAHYRATWLSEQHPAAEARLRGVEERSVPPTQKAVKALEALIERLPVAKPPLEEAHAARDEALGTMLSSLALDALLPPSPGPADVRGAVGRLIKEAAQLPPIPEYVDYSALLADIQQWIEDLEGAEGEMQAAQREAGQATAANSAQLAGLAKGDEPVAWKQLTWLSEQLPQVEARLGDVGAKLAPSGAAVRALQAARDYILGSKPPLAEAEGMRDMAIGDLMVALYKQGLDARPLTPHDDEEGGGMAASRDVTFTAFALQLIADAQQLPEIPEFVDYRPLLADLRRWVAELQAAQGDVQEARQAVDDASAANSQQLGVADEAADPEGWHRLSWLSTQYPLIAARLQEVDGKVAPGTGAAAKSLQDLRERVEATEPPLEECQAERDAAIAALAAALGSQSIELPASPAPEDVREAVQKLIEEARNLPGMPGWVDYRPLLADIAQWVEALQAAQGDVAAAQQAASQQAADSAAQFAGVDEEADPEDWHRLSWLCQQHPLVEARLGEVEGRVGPPAGATIASLQELAQRITSSKPPLEEAEAARDTAVAALISSTALEGLPQSPAASDVHARVQQLIADAQRLPGMPGWVDYRPLLADIAQWVAELEGSQGDVAAAQQAAGQRTAENGEQLAAVDEAADPEAHYRLNWLSQQHPLVESRLGEVEGRVGRPAGAAIASLQELAQRIKSSKPPLAEAEAARDAAVAALLSGAALEGLSAPAASDVRGAVQRLIEEAERLPEMPPMPVNYDDLLADIRQWIAELDGCQADVQAAQQAAGQQAADSAAQFAAADEEADPEGWHRLSWLSQQHPLAGERLQGLESKLEAMPAAAAALQELVQRIEQDKPPLADATAQRDAATLALMEGLSAHSINVQSAPGMRATVQQLIADAQRLPDMPAWVDYRPLLADIAQWVEALEGSQGDAAAAQQAAGQRTAENGEQLAACDIQEDPEGWHRLNWLSQQLPQVEDRLSKVSRRVEPAQEAVGALQALAEQVEGEKPPLAAAERSRDSAIAAVLAALALKKLPAQPSPGEVRDGVRQLIKKAQHLPPVPPMPVQLYVPPPAPEHHRSSIVAPKFNPPNLSAPRPRFKSRGVKPAPEDAIRRDPRAITLYNELAQGRGVVVTTIAWEATRKGEGHAGSASATPSGSAAATPRAGSAAATPRAGSATPPPSGRSAGGRAGSTSPAPSGGSSAVATPRTPTPRPPSPSPEPPEAELSEEEAAAYLPTLPARALAVTAFEPRSLQEVSDFVSDVGAQGGDAPRSAHAACAFPTRKWAVMVEAASVFDTLLDACDTLHKWECPPQASVVSEAHRLADLLEATQKVVARVSYPHDALRVRMAKAGLPWDDALLTDLRWAAQRAAAALMRHALDNADTLAKAKGKWQTSAMVQPLGSAFCGAFKVHQFCGGFNLESGALFDTLHERTVHYARMMDPAWFRSSKVAG
ncbi:hypothetical protein ABPG75_002320 [Micractinium tetrahymenae]